MLLVIANWYEETDLSCSIQQLSQMGILDTDKWVSLDLLMGPPNGLVMAGLVLGRGG